MITKQQVEGLIERLADKTLSRECLIKDKEGFPHVILMKNSAGNYLCEVMNNVQHTIKKSQIKEVLGHPIYIGNVLSKIDKAVGGCNYYIGLNTYNDELIHLWSRCGKLTQSLQEIIKASGWKSEYVGREICTEHNCNYCHCEKYQVLTSPEANALFSFLQQIL